MNKTIKIPTKKFGTVTAELSTQQFNNVGYDGKPNPAGPKNITLYIAECKIKDSCYVSTAGSAEKAIKDLRMQLDRDEDQVAAQYAVAPPPHNKQHIRPVKPSKPVIKRR